MNDEFRRMVIEALQRGDQLSHEWIGELFPSQKREYELTYQLKQEEEDIINETMAIPLQPISTFGKSHFDWSNRLIFGDNLQVMKTLLEQKRQGELYNTDGTPGVKLVYIDPPFGTRQDFSGNKDQKAYRDKIAGAEFLEFLRKRLVLLREILSDDGAIYVHLDTRKVHYVKVLMDEIFGEANFRNEIIWFYPRGGDSEKQFNRKHDTILFYSKSSKWTFNYHDILIPYTQEQLDRFDQQDEKGRFYWNVNPRGERVKTYLRKNGIGEYDVWNIGINSSQIQSIGYPTLKPEALLERIIKASSNRGDIVLDAFAGGGTCPAVAEKLDRRWIAIDCGKLSIYTIQRRLLTLYNDTNRNNKRVKETEVKPFTLYNAGLYDFSKLRQLNWKEWRFFALNLFGCRDEPHSIGGLALDGKLKGASVLVFNHLKHPNQSIDEDTIQEIHITVCNGVNSKFFIIAPRNVFSFQQDYIDIEGIRYYAMRIPYSIINELHNRDFTALRQPMDENNVNDTVDSIGFDFIRPPKVTWSTGKGKRSGQIIEEAYIEIKSFKSQVRLRGEDTFGGIETLSMIMFDFDYDDEIFNLDTVFFNHQIKFKEWKAWFPIEKLGNNIMVVFVDIHGNELRIVIPQSRFNDTHHDSTSI